MTDFGKLNFSVAFNPTSAFPLDARCYFESLAEAEVAAASAKEVGSAESVYYYGQRLLVKDGSVYKWYEITANNTLADVEGANGTNGKDGADGISPTVVITKADGVTTIRITDKDGEHIGKVYDGTNGTNGTNGKDGADGKAPVKGEDYFTEADKTELVNDVLSALPTWEGGSY